MATKSKNKKQDQEKENFIEAGQEVVTTRQKIMAQHGLDLSFFCGKIKGLCDATKSVSCISGKDADSKTVDFVDVPDNMAIAKGIDLGLNLGGFYPPKELKADVNHSGNIMATVIKVLNDRRRESK